MVFRNMLGLVMVLALGACVRDRTIEFQVPEPPHQINAGWTQAVGLDVKVSDVRHDKTRVGKATVEGMSPGSETVSVKASNKLEEAVRKGVVAEFRSLGVKRFDGPVRLLVDISVADSRTSVRPFDVSVQANAELRVQVVASDGRVLYRNSYARRDSGKGETWTMETIEQGAFHLQKVMAMAIQSMVEDQSFIQALITASR